MGNRASWGGWFAAFVVAIFTCSTAAAAATKVDVCHNTGSGTQVLINVSENAVPAHERHGDTIAPDFANDPANCGGCGVVCDDGDPCTVDSCSEGACAVTPKDCDDANVCTDDSCDSATGDCVNTAVPDRECDDADACTEGDVCTAEGTCGGTATSCDDANECTADTCDPATGCANTPTPGASCSGDTGTCDDTGACIPNPA